MLPNTLINSNQRYSSHDLKVLLEEGIPVGDVHALHSALICALTLINELQTAMIELQDEISHISNAITNKVQM